MTLARWNPRRSLVSLPNEIDRFFGDMGLGFENFDKVWNPNIDISESEEVFEVVAEIPGMSKEDIKISIKENVLTLTGEKKQEEKTDKKNFHRAERMYGQFQRSFQLPNTVKSDDIKAKYENGVLNITIPKAEEVKPKEISVS